MSIFLIRCILKAWCSRTGAPTGYVNIFLVKFYSKAQWSRSGVPDLIYECFPYWIMLVFTMSWLSMSCFYLYLQWFLTSMCWLCLYLQRFYMKHLDFTCIYNDFNMQVVIMLVFTMVRVYIVLKNKEHQ